MPVIICIGNVWLQIVVEMIMNLVNGWGTGNDITADGNKSSQWYLQYLQF